MDNKEVSTTIQWLLRTYQIRLAENLCSCVNQQENTTKHGRRERALSYLLESLTGDYSTRFTADGAIRLLGLIQACLANAKSAEAKVGLERTEKRLHYLLEDPMRLSGNASCVACHEIYQRGTSHQCTNATARGKDAQLARDPDVLL